MSNKPISYLLSPLLGEFESIVFEAETIAETFNGNLPTGSIFQIRQKCGQSFLAFGGYGGAIRIKNTIGGNSLG